MPDRTYAISRSRLVTILSLITLLHSATAAQLPTNLPQCGMKCLFEVVADPAFSQLTQKQLCHDRDFSVVLSDCLKEICTIKETLSIVNVSATECGLPVRDDHQKLRISSLTIFSITIACFGLMIISRCLEKSKWGLDDVFMSLSAVFLVLQMVFLQLMITEGAGRDVWTLTEDHITAIFKLFFAQQLGYCLILGAVKASILAFYLRIFPDHKFRIVVWVTQSVNFGSTVIYLALFMAQRKPISLNWEGWVDKVPRGIVLNPYDLYISHGAFNIVLDVWMVILPYTQLYHLGLKLRKKIGVLAMFSVGLFIVAASIIRFIALISLRSKRHSTESDSSTAIMWGYIELCVGVMVGCMPNLRQLIRKINSLARARYNHDACDDRSTSGIFRQRSLELISDATTTVNIETARNGRLCGDLKHPNMVLQSP